MTRVKICGITESVHARTALEAGADMLGFVFAPSRRRIGLEAATSIIQECRAVFSPDKHGWQAVGVFANQPLGFVLEVAAFCSLDAVQLCGDEPPEFGRAAPAPLIRTLRLPSKAFRSSNGLSPLPQLAEAAMEDLRVKHGATRLLLDSRVAGFYGGTGESFHWEGVGKGARSCIVAGGLGPANVASAIAAMDPWGVDVSSGVERDGRKDPELIRRFVWEVRRCKGHANRASENC
jgi:phosphoribosylanthranilate isomerase